MTDSDNIDRFNENSGLIFAKLYENFPEPMLTLSAEDVLSAEQCELEIDGKQSPEAGAFTSALHWLYNQGLIHGELMKYGIAYAVPTMKGFEVLQRIPEGFKMPFAQELKQSIKKGALDAVSELVRKAMVGFIGAGIG
jgi:hypothetical protein